MIDCKPKRPTHISLYAELCLKALASAGLGQAISLGRAFGLLHYLDYRPTNDIDAWWAEDANPVQRTQVVEVVAHVLAAHGEVRQREWGDVVSLDLIEDRKTIFSFQFAVRSVQLNDTVSSSWTDVQLDSLDDLIASKMVALVERGAPRDFRDIYAVCETRIISPQDCWQLWRVQQERTGRATSFSRAKLAMTTQLKRIELSRPLDTIADERQRMEAEKTRSWFSEEFLNAGVD